MGRQVIQSVSYCQHCYTGDFFLHFVSCQNLFIFCFMFRLMCYVQCFLFFSIFKLKFRLHVVFSVYENEFRIIVFLFCTVKMYSSYQPGNLEEINHEIFKFFYFDSLQCFFVSKCTFVFLIKKSTNPQTSYSIIKINLKLVSSIKL